MIMIVSRGLGDQIKLPRLYNAPEIVWVTLYAGSSNDPSEKEGK